MLSGEGNDSLMHFQMWPYVKDMMRNREWQRLLVDTRPLSLAAAFGFTGTQATRAEPLRERSAATPAIPALAGAGLCTAIEFARTAPRNGTSFLLFALTLSFPRAMFLSRRRIGQPMFELESAGAHALPGRSDVILFSICESSITFSRFHLFLCFSRSAFCERRLLGGFPSAFARAENTLLAGDPLVAHFGQIPKPVDGSRGMEGRDGLLC